MKIKNCKQKEPAITGRLFFSEYITFTLPLLLRTTYPPNWLGEDIFASNEIK
ncbi:hypothetical protein HMPREF3202_00108 [Prevotella bivia]|uniref:Uncharacterized protein n=1 Tax=Prevotella bivia TaxID=28125 RepID=A0A137T1C2_9BACT|nr:hypothetical protein HMPREF3202_00108 [Prevotella bivia]